MDELPEFGRECIEVMRQPLEEKKIQIARTQGTYVYPADFMLIAAANPCPCGYYPDRSRCHCSERQIRAYQNKISGPIRDRIDVNVTAHAVDIRQLNADKSSLNSEKMRQSVMQARNRQEKRFEETNLRFNSDIPSGEIARYCALGEEEGEYIEKVFHALKLSARSYHKVIKVARTIADVEGEDRIRKCHLAEAVGYRTWEEGSYVQ